MVHLFRLRLLGIACALAPLGADAASAFTDIGANLIGLTRSYVSWGDYDNDGDLDIIMCGRDSTFALRTLVYRNDGDAGFTLQPNALPDAAEAPVLWGDYNGDGALDVLLSGSLFSVADGVYRNEGNGIFTPVALFQGAWGGAGAWGDFDSDGDLDLMIVTAYSIALPTLYFGNGATFTPGYAYPWWVVGPLTASAIDFDNDGRLDFVITPVCNNGLCQTRVLRNLGHATAFEEIQNTLPTTGWGAAPWVDHDNDGYLDILLNGSGGAVLCRNLGGGLFSQSTLPFEGLEGLGGIWGNFDYDNDGRPDAWVYGSFSNSGPQIRLLKNIDGAFVDSHISLPALNWESAAWGDFDNDGDLDIVCVGNSDGFTPFAAIYRNETTNKNIKPAIPGGLQSSVTNDSVTLVWGASTDSNQVGGLSYNVRFGTAPDRCNIVPSMADPKTGWRRIPQRGNAGSRLTASYDNLVPGVRYYWSVQAIDNTFAGSAFASEESFYVQAPPAVSAIGDQMIRYSSSTAPVSFTVSDLETPADQLILTVSSSDTNLVPHSGITLEGNEANRTIIVTPAYLQLGSAYITLVVTDTGGRAATNGFALNVTNSPPSISMQPNVRIRGGESVAPIAFQIGDVDSPPADLNVDVTFSNTNLLQGIVLSGTGSNRVASLNVIPAARGITTVTLAVRDAMGASATNAFTFEIFGFELVASGILGVQLGALDWGDFDNDGDLDVSICGQAANRAQVTGIFRNHGIGSFSVVVAPITGITSGGLAWGDYDNDGDLDLVYSGGATRVQRNNSDGTFSPATPNLESFISSKVTWMDYDNDGDLDVIATGTGVGGIGLTRVFQNIGHGMLTNAMVNLPGALGAIAWSDYDRDGDLDLAAAGIGTVFRNEGNGVFVNIQAGLQPIPTRLQSINYGSIAWGDYDNDGWPDLLLTGDNSGVRYTRLYRNNGNDTFSEIDAGIPDATSGQAAWGDYDNDGALDVLLTGSIPARFAGIYRNNGNGRFVDLHENWPGVNRSAAAWGDFDGDGDLDVIYNGTTNGAESGSATILFRNLVQASNTVPTKPIRLNVSADQILAWDASSDAETTNSNGLTYNLRIGTSPGGSEVMSPHSGPDGTRRLAQSGNAGPALRWRADLPYGTYYWSVQAIDSAFAGSAFSDEAHLVVTNLRPAISFITNLTAFINHATSAIGFSVNDSETPASLLQLTASSSLTNVVPVENIFFGGTGSNRMVTILPATNATGVVTIFVTAVDEGGLSRSTSFRLNVTNPPPYISSIPNQSVPLPYPAGPIFFIVGDLDSSPETLTLTARSSNPNLIPDENIVFGGTGTNRSITLTPIKTDPDTSVITVIVTDAHGRSASTTFVLTVERFTLVATDLVQNTRGSLAWGDFDNDNDLDLLVSGQHTPALDGWYPLVYRNNNGQFSQVWMLPENLIDCSVAWGDYNNDGWLDFANIGRNAGAGVYPNNKDGTFSGWGIGRFIHSGSVAWGDADDDGDLDLLLTGGTGTRANRTAIFNNERAFFHGDTVNAIFPPVRLGSGIWADFDNDGDLDILLTGLPLEILSGEPIGANNGITKLFRHESGSTFIDSGVLFPGTYHSAAASADFDNDGWLDFAISGNTWTNSITKLFRNNTDGTFSEISSGLPAVQIGSLSWADWDNDGFADLLLTGTTDGSPTGAITRVYRNNRDGTFNDIQAGLPGVYGGSAQWGDYDNDGDLDIALCGSSSSSTFPTRVYRNNNLKPNLPPPVPSGLSSIVVSNQQVTLTWSPTNISGTSNGLTYNLRVGRTPGGDEVVASHSASNGFRRLPAAGNSGLATNRFLRLPRGTYYWSAQTINAGLVGSPFSPEQSFTLTNIPPIVADISGTTPEDFLFYVPPLTAIAPDGQLLTFSIVAPPSNGFLWGALPDALVYQPNPNFFGTDQFTYKVNDGLTDSAPATISVDVTPVQDVDQTTITLEFGSQNHLTLRLAGEPYQQYWIESSVDLIEWGELARVHASPDGCVVWTNAVNSSGQQFFRSRMEPQ